MLQSSGVCDVYDFGNTRRVNASVRRGHRDMSMTDRADILASVCLASEASRPEDARRILSSEYPFAPFDNAGRRYNECQSMRVFTRDGFVDRYSGARLVFPGTLRLLSILFPGEFPFQKNWKTDECHFAFYELFPTIDHVVPVSRGGMDCDENYVTTSMIRNTAKANFTIEELGWKLLSKGSLRQWDGLTSWFVRAIERRTDLLESGYVRNWAVAAKSALAIPNAS